MRAQNDNNSSNLPSDDYHMSWSNKDELGFTINVLEATNNPCNALGTPRDARIDFVCVRDHVVFCAGAFNGFNAAKFY